MSKKQPYTTTVDYEAETLASVQMPAGVTESDITEAVTRLEEDGKIVASDRDYVYGGKTYIISHRFAVEDSVMTVTINVTRLRAKGGVPVALKRPGDITFRPEVNDEAVKSVKALIEVEHLVADLVSEREGE